MKTQKTVIFFLSVSACIFSCDKLDELTEFDINEDFNTTINVALTEDSEGEAVNLAKTAIINIAGNQDIQDNLSLIQDVVINSITYQIDNYVGGDDVTVTSASLSFASTVISVADINLKQSNDGNTVYTISDAAQLNAIGNYLESNSSVNVTLSGTISSTPAQFNVKITMDTTVTVDAG